MTDIKRTRLGDAFAALPKTVRKSYVTVKDVNHVRKRHRSKEWVVELTERLNRYCHAADQLDAGGDVGGVIRRIEAALRKEYGADEAKRCIRAAYRNKDFRLRDDFLIPQRLWAKTWAAAKERPKHKPKGIQEDGGHGLPGDINRQMENRATPSQIRGLIQKVWNDKDVKFSDDLYKLNSALAHLEESHNQLEKRYRDHAFTDAWQRTVEALRKDLDDHQSHPAFVESWIEMIDKKADAAKDEAHKVTYLSSVVAKHIMKDHRRRFPNPFRPLLAVVRRVASALKVLVRGEEIPFR